MCDNIFINFPLYINVYILICVDYLSIIILCLMCLKKLKVESFEIKNVFLPNVSAYIKEKKIHYKCRSRVREKKIKIKGLG